MGDVYGFGGGWMLFGLLEECSDDSPARFGGAVCKMRARVVQDGDVMLVCEVICA